MRVRVTRYKPEQPFLSLPSSPSPLESSTPTMSFPGQAGLYKETVSRLAGVIGFTYVPFPAVLPFPKLIPWTRSYLVQTAFAAVAVPLQTEKFYDIAGACGFLTSTILSAYYPSFRSLLPASFKFANVAAPLSAAERFGNPFRVLGGRQILLSMMALTWTSRLGSFLAQRIMKDGKDSRFDEIKKNPLLFSGAWYVFVPLTPCYFLLTSQDP